MANYVIEGTVTEIKIEGTNCTFKICGAEGYSVKHGDKKYNILYSEDIKEKSDKNAISTFVLFADRIYKTSEKQEFVLAAAFASSKKVRVTIDATDTEIKSGVAELSVSSITTFSD